MPLSDREIGRLIGALMIYEDAARCFQPQQWRFWHEVAEGLRGHLLHA